jgi:hypothetical protein
VVLLLLVAGFASGLIGLQPGAAEAAAGDLSSGDSGPRVAALQQMLSAQRFYRGSIDGVFGAELEAAVIGFHKEVRMARTGVWAETDWELLARYKGPWLPARSGEPDRVEVNLTAQVAYLVKADHLVAIIPVSSGNGELFRSRTGGLAVARTPRGDFHLQRHIHGWRQSYLGTLYEPWYFYGGYALHGSPSVPAWPASHGCIRVNMWEADFLEGQLYLGMPMHVWDAPSWAGPAFHDEPIAGLYQPRFVDDEGSFHQADINALADRGITQGCGRFRYCPAQVVTREQMASFLVRALALPPTEQDFFVDDEGSLHEQDINALAAAGITAGCGESGFCPGAAVTRAQLASLLARSLDLPPTEQDFFADDNGSPHEADANALAAAGITNGCAPGAFCPQESTTREQAASFLVRAPAVADS